VGSLREVLSERRFQASVKAALDFRGLPVHPDVRAPLRPLTMTAKASLRARLEGLVGAGMLAPSASTPA
jgi:dihydrodipicolinate synthase/N-acetylneuraminate lyase